jgi:aromatic ring hydroxylase
MIRSGQDYIKGLQAQAKKNVWIAGRKIDDVVADPHFKRPVATLAELYDLQCSPQHGVKMSAGGSGSAAYGLSFLIPRRTEDIVDRRNAMAVWANATFGMVGRSPDYCNTVLMSFEETGFFHQAVLTSART